MKALVSHDNFGRKKYSRKFDWSYILKKGVDSLDQGQKDSNINLML